MVIPRAPRFKGSRVRTYGPGVAQVTTHNDLPGFHKRHLLAAEAAARAGALAAVREAKAILRLQDIQGPSLHPATVAMRTSNSTQILLDTRILLQSIEARRERVGLWLAGVYADQSHPGSDLPVGAIGRIHEYGMSGTRVTSEGGLGPHYFFGKLGGGIPARHWISLVHDDELGRKARVTAAMRTAYLLALGGKKDLYGLSSMANTESD